MVSIAFKHGLKRTSALANRSEKFPWRIRLTFVSPFTSAIAATNGTQICGKDV